jgi:thioredoxin-related protein
LRIRLLLTCAAALLIIQPVLAGNKAPSLLEFDLRSLGEADTHSLERYKGKTVLLVFFQPDCDWCLKQFRAVNELRSTCSNSFEAIAIGTRGSRSELRKELRRLRPEFPAYQASPALLESLGGVETTPISLLGDSSGGFVNWLRGYIAYDQLRTFVEQAGDLSC